MLLSSFAKEELLCNLSEARKECRVAKKAMVKEDMEKNESETAVAHAVCDEASHGLGFLCVNSVSFDGGG